MARSTRSSSNTSPRQPRALPRQLRNVNCMKIPASSRSALTARPPVVMIRGLIEHGCRSAPGRGSKEWPRMALAQLTVVVSALLGWADNITIQPSRGERHSPFHRSVAGIDRPSERTLETLKRYDLQREYHRDVNSALLRI